MCFVYRAFEIQHFCFWFISIFFTFMKTGFICCICFYKVKLQTWLSGNCEKVANIKANTFFVHLIVRTVTHFSEIYSRILVSDVIYFLFFHYFCFTNVHNKGASKFLIISFAYLFQLPQLILQTKRSIGLNLFRQQS